MTVLHGHDASLDYHRRMLVDVVRMDAYDRAIRKLVRPGDVVLDVGAGTGILAMLAARAGAARVHAVESMPVAEIARELVASNGLGERVIVHRADLVTMDPVERVDLVVSDFLGPFLTDDAMLPAVAAAGRWL
jgi:predicted RNA methylase